MFESFHYYLKAHQIVWKKELRIFLLLPALINLLLLGVLFWISFLVSDLVISNLEAQLFGAVGEGWLKSILIWVVSFLIRIILFACYFMIYKSLILILMSPFLSLLIDRVHQDRTGLNAPWSFRQIIRDAIRGIKIAIRNIFIQLLLMGLIGMIGFLPMVGMVSPFFLLLVEFYFYGFSMMDYTNEIHQISVNNSIERIRKHKWKAVGNGMVFYLMLITPVIGWLFAPSYGAVAAYLQLEELD